MNPEYVRSTHMRIIMLRRTDHPFADYAYTIRIVEYRKEDPILR